MTLHAFVDESRRNKDYLVAAALIVPGDLRRLRTSMRGLLLPGQKELHFKKETPSRRREIASRLAEERIAVRVYLASCALGEEAARRVCVVHLVEDALAAGASRMVLDSREVRDEDDRVAIRAVLGKRERETGFAYEHFDSTQEPLLWIADAVVWCYGAGGDWRRRIGAVLEEVIDLRDRP